MRAFEAFGPGRGSNERYAAIVRALGDKPGVTHESARGKGFGSSGQLKVNNRIFAMLVGDALVVKLPRSRVESLVASKQGIKFDPRRDRRLMKEWIVIAPQSESDWLVLAKEALGFVSQPQPRGRPTEATGGRVASSPRTSRRRPARSRS